MKRQTIFGTLAALALSIVPFIAASPAQAACTNVNASAGYPNGSFVQYCGTAVQADANAVLGAVAGAVGSAQGELRTAFNRRSVSEGTQGPGVQYFVFGTSAQYSAMFPGPVYPVPTATDFGVTYFDGSNKPVFTAIFKQNGAGTTNAFLANTTGFQIGRTINALMGYVNNGGVVKTPYPNVSTSTVAGLFNAQLTKDWTQLNLKAACAVNSAGVFNGQADPTVAGTVYICDGTNGTGSNLTANYTMPAHYANNQALLQHMYPGTFTTAAQILAEEYGYWGGPAGSDTAAQPKSKDIYIKPTGPAFQFTCSAGFIKELGSRGILPRHTMGTTDVMQDYCPTVPFATSVCFKKFINTGHSPDGRMLDCMVQPASDAGAVESKLRGFGGNSDTAPIKKLLESVNQFIYVFSQTVSGSTVTPADTYFHNLFNSAYSADGFNFNDPAYTITSANGISFPVGTNAVWYTILNISSGDNSTLTTPPNRAPNDDKVVYTTAHELGHIIDLTLGQPSHSATNTNFDKAMQNDWLLFDYEDAAGTVKRPPCGLGAHHGPFVGLTDPVTHNPYCDGAGNLTTTEAQIYPPATTRNSQILKLGFDDVVFQTASKPVGKNPGVVVQSGWTEWLPATFAIVSTADLTSTTNRADLERATLINGLFAGGYFGCTAGTNASGYLNGWVEHMYTTGANTTIASLPARCQLALPAGFGVH